MTPLAFLVATVTGVPAASAATGDGVVQLLSRVSATYRSLTTYVIEVERSASAHTIGTPAPERSFTTICLFTRLGFKIRYDVIQGDPRQTWVSDGRETWVYRADLNEYTVSPAAEWKDPPPADSSLPRREWDWISRFRALYAVADRATMVELETPSDSTCNGVTVRVNIDLGDRSATNRQQLRIYRDSGLVCESREQVTRAIGGTHALYSTNTHWIYKQITGPVDEQLFTFTPPKRAKLVPKFRHVRSSQ